VANTGRSGKTLQDRLVAVHESSGGTAQHILPPQPSVGQFNTNSFTQPLHYTEFIKCFRYNMYRVTLSRNLRITWSVTHVWFPFSPKYFVILSAKQRTKSTEPMFHSKKNYYYFLLWFLNVCSYSLNFLFTYLWFHSHLPYILITLRAHIHLYTHSYNITHLYIHSFLAIHTFPLTHLLIHLFI